MGIRLCGIGFLPLALCVLLGTPAAGQEKKQKPQNSVESLFEGLPADLRKNLKNNQVRRDRVNDWLKEHVNGKGKTVEVRVPAEIIPTRAKDGTYDIEVQFQRSSPPTFKINALGDEWTLALRGMPVVVPKKGKGLGGKGVGGRGFFRPSFHFVGVSTADAEKLADLKAITIQGKVDKAALGSGGISLVLDDVRVEGKKLTPYNPAADK